MFLNKPLGSVSAAAGVALVGVMDSNAEAATQSAQEVLGIKLASALIPAIGLFSAAIIIWNFPLSRVRTAEMQAQIQLREQGVFKQ